MYFNEIDIQQPMLMLSSEFKNKRTVIHPNVSVAMYRKLAALLSRR